MTSGQAWRTSGSQAFADLDAARRLPTRQEIHRLGPFLEANALGGLCRSHRLLACPGRDGKPLYPAWQFDEHRQPLPGLSTVLAMLLPAADGWTVARWLRTRMGELDVDPLTWLAKGRDPTPVFAAARSAVTRWHRDRARSDPDRSTAR